MLNIIIYEDDKVYLQKDVDIINHSLAENDIDYRIHKFKSYSNKLRDIIVNNNLKKVYILNVDMNVLSGLEVASLIRQDDWDSVIIFVTTHDKYHNDTFYNRMMALDFICKTSGYEKRLSDDIMVALKILYKQKTFVFKYNHVVYRIPYNHICYVEKEPLIKRCVIHTLNNKYYVVDSINRLVKRLGVGFYKTHQSCIVNINNIKRIDLSTNTIIFKDGSSTNMLTENRKKEIKQYVGLDN